MFRRLATGNAKHNNNNNGKCGTKKERRKIENLYNTFRVDGMMMGDG